MHFKCAWTKDRLDHMGQVSPDGLALCKRCTKGSSVCVVCDQPTYGTGRLFYKKMYHNHHFNCKICKTNLANGVAKHWLGDPYCLRDYERYAKHKCSYCGRVKCSPKMYALLDKLWGSKHLFCYVCNTSLE